MDQRYDMVFGDGGMALYVNGRLAIAGVMLTFSDILETCDIPCDLWDAAHIEDPEQFPDCIEDLKLSEIEEV